MHKGAAPNCGKHYTIFKKNYIIHTFQLIKNISHYQITTESNIKETARFFGAVLSFDFYLFLCGENILSSFFGSAWRIGNKNESYRLFRLCEL